jgi:hypothetical protein
MALDPKSQPYTAFTVPAMRHFEWKADSLGLASAPSAFQRLVELVVKGISNVVIYIDDLIIYSKTHEEHLQTLDAVFTRLASHNLRVNLKKCVFGSNETSYLGFWLSKNGIFPGTDKLKAVRDAEHKMLNRLGSFWGSATSFGDIFRTSRKLPLLSLI